MYIGSDDDDDGDGDGDGGGTLSPLVRGNVDGLVIGPSLFLSF